MSGPELVLRRGDRRLRLSRPGVHSLVSGLLAQTGARAAFAALQRQPPGGAALWNRVNHRGETLTLLEGPAYIAGAALGVALAPGLTPRTRVAGLVALAGAGGFGAIDDLRESGRSKGLRGHLTELAHGRITTGGLKILGIGATGLVSAVLAGDARPGDLRRGDARLGDARRGDSRLGPSRGAGRRLVSAGVIAGSANLINLLDLRPGRALKVVVLSQLLLRQGRHSGDSGQTGSSVLATAAAGAAGALLRPDLGEQSMLGDTGANAAGALLGLAAVRRLGVPGQVALLTVLTGLTLASEKVSFTTVIESTPGLREFDAFGRRPRA